MQLNVAGPPVDRLLTYWFRETKRKYLVVQSTGSGCIVALRSLNEVSTTFKVPTVPGRLEARFAVS